MIDGPITREETHPPEGQESRIQRFFTDRARLYDNIFLGLFRYGDGLRAFFSGTHYLRSDMKILDAGCGSGAVTRAMYAVAQKRALRQIVFHGFDLTPAMLDRFRGWIAAERAAGIELREVSVRRLDSLSGEWRDYDLIVSSGMLEYLPRNELSKTLLGLRHLLKPEGSLLVFITRRNFIMRWLIEAWWKTTAYERDEMRRKFQNAGFPTIRFGRFPFPFTTFNLWGLVIEGRNSG
jgi:cyclopropane fatty-acyl-phospholipid synthase-like methyltransferase